MWSFVEANAHTKTQAHMQNTLRHAQTHRRTDKQGYWEREGPLEGRRAANPGSVVSIQKRNRPLKA